MKLRFTYHARYRLDERGLALIAEKIKQTINTPDSRELLPKGKVKCKKVFGNKTLVVVYIKPRKEFLILSAYYL